MWHHTFFGYQIKLTLSFPKKYMWTLHDYSRLRQSRLAMLSLFFKVLRITFLEKKPTKIHIKSYTIRLGGEGKNPLQQSMNFPFSLAPK